MNRRTLTAAPILVGSVAGGLVAWFGASPSAAPPTVESARALAAPPSAVEASPPAELVPSATASAPERLPVATLASNVAAPAAPSVGPSPSVAPARATAAIFDSSPITSEASLMAAQLGCNKQSPEDCDRAGRSLESGSAGVSDAARARGLRRMALTLYVKQCESGRVAACVRLAEMYETGDIVKKDPKNAAALRDRADELCSKRPSDADCRR